MCFFAWVLCIFDIVIVFLAVVWESVCACVCYFGIDVLFEIECVFDCLGCCAFLILLLIFGGCSGKVCNLLELI